MQQFRFRKFQVYQDSLEFRKYIRLVILQFFPNNQRFILIDQLERASNSIILNIAEGSAKNSDKSFANFLSISVGSLHECVACLDIAFNDKFIPEKVHQEALLKAVEISNQLTAFRKRVLSNVKS